MSTQKRTWDCKPDIYELPCGCQVDSRVPGHYYLRACPEYCEMVPIVGESLCWDVHLLRRLPEEALRLTVEYDYSDEEDDEGG